MDCDWMDCGLMSDGRMYCGCWCDWMDCDLMSGARMSGGRMSGARMSVGRLSGDLMNIGQRIVQVGGPWVGEYLCWNELA